MVEREQPFAVDEEAHFILAMRVFGQEFFAQRRAVGMIGRDPRDIDRLIAALCRQPRHFVRIDREHIAVGCDGLERPAFEADSRLLQCRLDLSSVGGVEQRRRGIILGKDLQAAHRKLLSASSAAIIHSTASITRSASAMSWPQPYKPWLRMR